MARIKLNPDQLPLITPNSNWTVPTELPDLRRVGVLSIDTETKDDGLAQGRGPGWVYGAGYVCGVSAAWRAGSEIKKIYVPTRHPETECFPKDNVARWVRDITREGQVIFMNGPYDIGWLSSDMNIDLSKIQVHDVGCQAVMVDESRRPIEGFASPYSLDAIANWLGVPLKDECLLKEAGVAYGVKPSDIKSNLWRLPARYIGPYAEQDAATTLLAHEVMTPMLEEQDLVTAYQLEMDLIPLVYEMRRRGVRIDVERAETLRDELFDERDTALDEIRQRIGGRVLTIEDVRNQSWLVKTFSNEGVEFNSKNDKASFERDWMRQGYVGRYQEGRQGHWLPQLIAKAKQCHDAADKFVQGFLLDFAHRGRIHATVNQFKNEDGGTRTHRFSYSDPPLQQMPSRPEIFLRDWTLTGDIAKGIRGCFLPEPGEKWFSPDYSQQEYRLIVHFAALLGCDKAEWAVEKYVRDPNTDFHNMVVEMTGLVRQRAKDCNFAKSYGAGLKKFAEMTGMSEEEAANVMGQYDNEMPFVKQLGQRCDSAAQRRGYIRMIDGARMHFNFWEPKWLDPKERQRGWSEGWKMGECSLEEAKARQRGDVERPYRAPSDSVHPWTRVKQLKRAFTHKAGNGLIQGSAARMGKMAMRDMWRAGHVPLLQIHDEFPLSVARESTGQEVAEIMRNAFIGQVPFRVDEEYGKNWADAKHSWKDAEFAK